MAFLTRESDQFEAALVGGPVSAAVSDAVRADVEVALALRSVRLSAAPDPAFVAALGERLRREASGPETRPLHAVPTSRGPAVVTVRRRAPRFAAAVAASILVVAAVVGASARGALPGQVLYPVRGLLDRAAVTLAGSDLSRGITLLSHAERHVGEAQTLTDLLVGTPGGDVSPDSLGTALQGAIDTTAAGRTTLTQDWDSRGDVSSLVAMRDFTDRVGPAVGTLAGQVPATMRDLAGELQSSVGDMARGVTSTLAACTTCGPAGDQARQQLASAAASAGATAPGSPTAPATSPGPVPTGATTTAPGASVTVPGGGATVGPSGGSASATVPAAPTGTASATSPRTTAATSTPTLPPGPGGPTGRVTATVPGGTVTVPGVTITVPGVTATLTLPHVTAPLVTVPGPGLRPETLPIQPPG